MAKHGGNPLPESVIDSIARTGVAIKGPITTPVGTGFRSVNVALRKALDLFAQVRPCKSYAGVRSRYERRRPRDRAREHRGPLRRHRVRGGHRQLRRPARHDPEALGRRRSARTPASRSSRSRSRARAASCTFALDYARREGRRKVTVVHKANIMKHTDGLWLRVAREVAEGYPDIEFEDRIVDNMCMQLVQKPELYDVMVLPNLYGDIVSDLCAGLVGGLGVAPGANYGREAALFEPTHGSAPKYAGQNKANPTAMMLSGVLMLRHLGERDAADRMEARDRRGDRRGQGRHLRPQAASRTTRPPWARRSSPTRSSPSLQTSSMAVNRRAVLAAAAFLAAAWVLGLGTLLPSSNRWFLVLLAPALVYRRGLAYVRDFAPLALAVLVYEWARTTAHRINPDPFYRPQIDVDKVIGLGRVPSVRLQGWLYDGTPGAFEHALDHVHSWHVAALLGALFLLWLDSHARVPARGRSRARLRLRRGHRVPRLPRRAALAGRLPRPHRAARAHPRARAPVPGRGSRTRAPDAPVRRQPRGRRAVAARRLVDARRADHLALAAAAVADRRGLRARAAVRGRLPRRALRRRPAGRRRARARHVVAVRAADSRVRASGARARPARASRRPRWRRAAP